NHFPSGPLFINGRTGHLQERVAVSKRHLVSEARARLLERAPASPMIAESDGHGGLRNAGRDLCVRSRSCDH
ncbi:unnamed protein product, partial [Staurois parvus]